MSEQEVLEKSGWIMECGSPLEISLADDPESRATGWAARIVIEALRKDLKKKGGHV